MPASHRGQDARGATADLGVRPAWAGVWQTEFQALRASLEPKGIGVLEQTEPFDKAKVGRGEVLEQRGQQLAVLDQESGREWMTAPVAREDLDPAIYALFEREPDVREALFFDSGHPDAEGFTLFAGQVALHVVPLLK